MKREQVFIIGGIAIIIVAVLSLLVTTSLSEGEAHIYPDYSMIDIRSILLKTQLAKEDYKTLFLQTGLGEVAIEEIRRKHPNAIEHILSFQANFFREIDFVCEKTSLISMEESLVDENNNETAGTQLAPLHNGDILITKASHIYGWRNGHSAIVVDAANGKTLESELLCINSSVQDISKWINYRNFMLLRLENTPSELTESITQRAADSLIDIPYKLGVGIFSPKFAESEEIDGTYCSHLVWQAYSYYGIDLDSDGGMIVTPKDLARSPKLEVIQVYGVDPENIWP